MEGEMTKRSKRFLTFLLCAAIIGSFGCTTTTHRVEPSQAVMDDYGTGEFDIVLVGYANKDDPRNNPKKNVAIGSDEPTLASRLREH